MVALQNAEKPCSKCKLSKPISMFSRNKNNKDGLKFQCKDCDRIEIAAHRKKYPELAIAYRADYYKKNSNSIKTKKREEYAKSPDKYKKITRDWYSENRGIALQYAKSYREKNLTKVKDALALWRIKNKEWTSAYSKIYAMKNIEAVRNNWRLRRARKRNSHGSHTASDVLSMLISQKYKCACCKTGIRKRYHVDHVIALANGGSNDKKNLQLLCPTCNLRKGAKDPIEFMQSQGYLI